MSLRKIRRCVLAGMLAALAGCASLADRPPADSSREDLVYFENQDGKYEKFATILTRSPDGRSTYFIRSPDGRSVVVCAGQPPVAVGATAGAVPGAVAGRETAEELLRVAFFQNCIARANGFIDERDFVRSHRLLIEAVARFLRSGKAAEGSTGSATAR